MFAARCMAANQFSNRCPCGRRGEIVTTNTVARFNVALEKEVLRYRKSGSLGSPAGDSCAPVLIAPAVNPYRVGLEVLALTRPANRLRSAKSSAKLFSFHFCIDANAFSTLPSINFPHRAAQDITTSLRPHPPKIRSNGSHYRMYLTPLCCWSSLSGRTRPRDDGVKQ